MGSIFSLHKISWSIFSWFPSCSFINFFVHLITNSFVHQFNLSINLILISSNSETELGTSQSHLVWNFYEFIKLYTRIHDCTNFFCFSMTSSIFSTTAADNLNFLADESSSGVLRIRLQLSSRYPIAHVNPFRYKLSDQRLGMEGGLKGPPRCNGFF